MENINEHDKTKEMMRIIRGTNKSNLLSEEKKIIKLSLIEQEIFDDIVSSVNTLNEGFFEDTMEKVKSWAKRGALTAAIVTNLMATPNFSNAQKSQIQQVASTSVTTQSSDNVDNTQTPEAPESSEDDSLSPVAGDAVFKDELKKLQDIVSSRTTILNFKIYPSDNNVIIEGEINEVDLKIPFTLSFLDGLKLPDGISLTDKSTEIVNKLKGYYDIWGDEWSKKMVNEYPPKRD